MRPRAGTAEEFIPRPIAQVAKRVPSTRTRVATATAAQSQRVLIATPMILSTCALVIAVVALVLSGVNTGGTSGSGDTGAVSLPSMDQRYVTVDHSTRANRLISSHPLCALNEQNWRVCADLMDNVERIIHYIGTGKTADEYGAAVGAGRLGHAVLLKENKVAAASPSMAGAAAMLGLNVSHRLLTSDRCLHISHNSVCLITATSNETGESRMVVLVNPSPGTTELGIGSDYRRRRNRRTGSIVGDVEADGEAVVHEVEHVAGELSSGWEGSVSGAVHAAEDGAISGAEHGAEHGAIVGAIDGAVAGPEGAVAGAVSGGIVGGVEGAVHGAISGEKDYVEHEAIKDVENTAVHEIEHHYNPPPPAPSPPVHHWYSPSPPAPSPPAPSPSWDDD